MNNPFATPASSEGIEWKDLNGSLLLIEPTGVETGIPTVHGDTDAVRANIVALDGPQAGVVHDDALVFPKVLQSQLRSRIGQKVLGRLYQGQPKQGQSAPWLLAEATEQDVQAGLAYLQGSMQAAPPQQQPQAQPYNQGGNLPQPGGYQQPAQQWQQPQAQQPPAQQWQQPQAAQQHPAQHYAQAAANGPQGGQQQPQQWQQPQAAQQPPAAAPQQAGTVDAAQIQTLIAQGASDQDIAATTGANPQQIAAIRAFAGRGA